MPRDVRDLRTPPAVVHAKRFEPALAWDLVETRFDDVQQGPARCLLQREFDERSRLTGIVSVRIDREGMPGERKKALGFHFLDHSLPSKMLVTGMRDLPACSLPRHEWPLQSDAEPRAELGMIGQRAPDAEERSLQLNGLFDAITHEQPPGCLLIVPPGIKRNRFVALFAQDSPLTVLSTGRQCHGEELPRSGLYATSPPCRRAICLTKARPSPVPFVPYPPGMR